MQGGQVEVLLSIYVTGRPPGASSLYVHACDKSSFKTEIAMPKPKKPVATDPKIDFPVLKTLLDESAAVHAHCESEVSQAQQAPVISHPEIDSPAFNALSRDEQEHIRTFHGDAYRDGLIELAIKKGTLLPSFASTNVPPPLDFVFPGLLAGGVGMVAAPGGTGKTFLVMRMAISIASARGFAGVWERNEVAGKVVFLAAEDTRAVLHHRFSDMNVVEAHAGGLDENLVMISLAGRLTDMLNIGKNGKVERGGWYNAIKKLAVGARLLILDPIRRYHGCEENDSRHMTVLVQILEEIALETGCAILFTHHTNKQATFHGAGASQGAARGSSALTDGIRWQMNLWTMTKDEAKERNVSDAERKQYVCLAMAKSNYIAPGEDIWLKRQDGGAFIKAEFDTSGTSANSSKAPKRSALGAQKSSNVASHLEMHFGECASD
jgi:hypothetical protein